MLFLPLVSALVWFCVAIPLVVIFPGTLSNLVVELILSAWISVAIAYFKFLVLNRSEKLAMHGLSIAYGLLIGSIVALRILMPTLPE